jgi:hypothetical protein
VFDLDQKSDDFRQSSRPLCALPKIPKTSNEKCSERKKAVLRWLKPAIGLKAKSMRILMPILTLTLTVAAAAAPAQTAIGNDEQKLERGPGQDHKAAQAEEQTSNRTKDNVSAGTLSRFSFNRVENGFLRLDNGTGEVAYCGQTAGWTCQVVPIDAASNIESAKKDLPVLNGLRTEIARLQEDIAALKKEIAALKEPPPPRPPVDVTPPSDKAPDVAIKLPSPEEMARAREFIESTWRRLVEMIVTMQKDLMRKS